MNLPISFRPLEVEARCGGAWIKAAWNFGRNLEFGEEKAKLGCRVPESLVLAAAGLTSRAFGGDLQV